MAASWRVVRCFFSGGMGCGGLVRRVSDGGHGGPVCSPGSDSARRLRGCLSAASWTVVDAGDAPSWSFDLQRRLHWMIPSLFRERRVRSPRAPQWLHMASRLVRLRSCCPLLPARKRTGQESKPMEASNEHQFDRRTSAHAYDRDSHSLAALAGAAAASLAAATGASGADPTAPWAIGGSMRSAVLCLPGPRACYGAVWVCAAAECALCSQQAPCALNGPRHESSSINYIRESIVSKYVVFQLQLIGLNGLF